MSEYQNIKNHGRNFKNVNKQNWILCRLEKLQLHKKSSRRSVFIVVKEKRNPSSPHERSERRFEEKSDQMRFQIILLIIAWLYSRCSVSHARPLARALIDVVARSETIHMDRRARLHLSS